MGLALPLCANAQNHPHYTMFMYNKLLFNPAYAGNKNMTTVNAAYRSQWTGLNGAPKTFSVAVDGPVGNYVKPFRRVALGLSASNEQLGITNNTNLAAYYAYRIPMEKSVISFGLQAGGSLYSAKYSDLNTFQVGDNALKQDVNNSFLPNFGAGIYWSGEKHYISASAPNLLQNYYDDNRRSDDFSGKQLRSYYLSGGYVFTISDNFKLEPQVMGRYAGNSKYQLPVNVDMNLSAIFYDRLLLGVTYRTDKSIEGILHVQATKHLNVGYSYDYTVSGLNGYNNGSHEVVLGIDFIRDNNKYTNPRFIKAF